jgi:hypothetical protein
MSTTCSTCSEPLDESIYTADKQDNQYKSCPGCSQAAGKHAFRKASDFGRRNYKGREYIQSHCPECRSKQKAPSPAFTC